MSACAEQKPSWTASTATTLVVVRSDIDDRSHGGLMMGRKAEKADILLRLEKGKKQGYCREILEVSTKGVG
jgi:hypothetical protein